MRTVQRRSSGMDPSPLLPLGVFALVMMMLMTPLMMSLAPAVREVSIPRSTSLGWAIPLLVIAALFLTSSELLAPSDIFHERRYPTTTYDNFRRPVFRSPQYRTSTFGQLGGGGPSLGFIGLLAITMLLLPWGY